ncbi:hypothetical protein ES705_47976 [subsurface metagenome]
MLSIWIVGGQSTNGIHFHQFVNIDCIPYCNIFPTGDKFCTVGAKSNTLISFQYHGVYVILTEIPYFNHSVLSCREDSFSMRTECYRTHIIQMSTQGHQFRTGFCIPQFDCPIPTARSDSFAAGIVRHAINCIFMTM